MAILALLACDFLSISIAAKGRAQGTMAGQKKKAKNKGDMTFTGYQWQARPKKLPGPNEQWTAESRYQALLPIIQSATTAEMSGALATQSLPFGSTARKIRRNQGAAVSEEELKIWYELYTHLGKSGLITPLPPDVREVAHRMQGTYEMNKRTIFGREPYVFGKMHFKIVRETDTEVVLECFIQEAGTLHSWVTYNKGNDKPYTVIAYFLVTVKQQGPTVRRLAPNDPAQPMGMITIDVTFDGKVFGPENYPGLENEVAMQIKTRFIKHGDSYHNVGPGEIVIPPGIFKGRDDWNLIRDTETKSASASGNTKNTDILQYGSASLDTFDTYIKVSDKPEIDNPREFYERNKTNVPALQPKRSS